MKNLTIGDIQSIIEKNGSMTLELMADAGDPERAMSSACAFLNSDGGWVILGVTPDRKITGLNADDSTMAELASHLGLIEPFIDARVQSVPVPEKPGLSVIAIRFPPVSSAGAVRTYDGRPYWRAGGRTELMPREVFDSRLRAAWPQSISWERRPECSIAVSDLDEDALRQSIPDCAAGGRLPGQAHGKADALGWLKELRLVSDSGVILNAANVLFGRDPMMRCTQCMVRMARFEGTDKLYYSDMARSEGNLFGQYADVLGFCRKHLHMDDSSGSVRCPVPYSVIKEAAINMLVHRSWDAYNLTPSVAVYDDRVEFGNPGVFPAGCTWQSFLDGRGSMPHNPVIAEMFRRRGLMKMQGHGIRTIFEECEEAGLPEPVFWTDRCFVRLTIRFREPIASDGVLHE